MRFIYMTAKDREEARRLGRSLVEAQLAACVNVIDGMDSIYRWQGAVEESKEAVLIVKTDDSLVDELIAHVRRHHSYEVPCIVTLPILEGNPAYLAWLKTSVKSG